MKEDVRDPLFGVKLYCQNVQVLCFSDDRISKRHKGIQMIYSLYIFNKIKFPVANSTFKITRVKGPAGKVWVHSSATLWPESQFSYQPSPSVLK